MVDKWTENASFCIHGDDGAAMLTIRDRRLARRKETTQKRWKKLESNEWLKNEFQETGNGSYGVLVFIRFETRGEIALARALVASCVCCFLVRLPELKAKLHYLKNTEAT